MTGCPETSVRYYHSTLSKTPKEHRSKIQYISLLIKKTTPTYLFCSNVTRCSTAGTAQVVSRQNSKRHCTDSPVGIRVISSMTSGFRSRG